MTEYEYSPEAYERYTAKQQEVGMWVASSGRQPQNANHTIPYPNSLQQSYSGGSHHSKHEYRGTPHSSFAIMSSSNKDHRGHHSVSRLPSSSSRSGPHDFYDTSFSSHENRLSSSSQNHHSLLLGSTAPSSISGMSHLVHPGPPMSHTPSGHARSMSFHAPASPMQPDLAYHPSHISHVHSHHRSNSLLMQPQGSKNMKENLALYTISFVWHMAYRQRSSADPMARHLVIRSTSSGDSHVANPLHDSERRPNYHVLVPSKCARAIRWSRDQYLIVTPGNTATIVEPHHPDFIRDLSKQEYKAISKIPELWNAVWMHKPITLPTTSGYGVQPGESSTNIALGPSPYVRGIPFGDNFFHIVLPGDNIFVIGIPPSNKKPIYLSDRVWESLRHNPKAMEGIVEYEPLALSGREEFGG